VQTTQSFVNGRSQAVRLPRPFHFKDLTEVLIERDGDRTILSPIHRPSVERLIAACDLFEPYPDQQQQPTPDSRETLGPPPPRASCATQTPALARSGIGLHRW
jgi:virulence-associated protein VagC